MLLSPVKKQLPIALTILFALFTAAGNSIGAEKQPTASTPRLLPFVNDYCVGCHNPDKKKGDLDFESVNLGGVAQHPESWEKVVRKLRARQMPPAERKHRPEESEYKAVLSDLESTLDKAS